MTRLARVTGLDRTGVEVACAIRPTGHILQVANGKGITFRQASARAWSEAAELWASEQVDPALLRWDSWEGLRERRVRAFHPLRLGSAGVPLEAHRWAPALRLAWSSATDVFTGEPVLVPAQALRCLREGDWSLGPQIVGWTTNGMGAHPRREEALRHALLEAAERDQLARALPEGWTAAAISRRMLHRAVGNTPVGRWMHRLERRGFEVHLFDLTPARGLGLPVAGALLFDAERGPLPLTAGYACRLRPAEAALDALLEAAQSRLTDVHGAREDVQPIDSREAAILQRLCTRARPRRRIEEMPDASGKTPLRAALGAFWRGGHRVVAVAELAPPGTGLHVLKVVVPGFRLSALL